MSFIPFYDGLQLLLETCFRGATQPNPAKFRVALCQGTYNAASHLIDVVKLESLNSTRQAYAPAASSQSGGVIAFPTQRVTFTNAGTSTIDFDSAVLIADTSNFSNKPVSGIGGSTFTIAAHGFTGGEKIFFTGTAPSGLDLLRTYYVLYFSADTFQVSLSSGGSAVTVGSLAGDLVCRNGEGTPIAYKQNNPDGQGNRVRSIQPGGSIPVDVTIAFRGA